MKGLMLAMWLAQAADVATTTVALNRGCVEGNPIMPKSAPAIAGVKAGLTVALTWGAWRAKKGGRARMAATLLAAGIIGGAVPAAWNLHVIPSCGH